MYIHILCIYLYVNTGCMCANPNSVINNIFHCTIEAIDVQRHQGMPTSQLLIPTTDHIFTFPSMIEYTVLYIHLWCEVMSGYNSLPFMTKIVS